MSLQDFHPAVAQWFERALGAPTEAQRLAWPEIVAGRNTLVAAPTGSGKTLTAFLAAIDALVRQGLSEDGLADATAVLYVSPLKALSNDIRLNLEAPLAGIAECLAASGLPAPAIRAAVRTGDTPQKERQQALRKPPHILVTTPESLYVLLGSASGRRMLSTVRTVIVDEIHAVAANKRGSHLAISLERLQALCAHPLVRIGLSATQKPIAEIARFLCGVRDASDGVGDCAIVDIGYAKQRDLALELPSAPLGAVMSHDQWEQVYRRIAELARGHRTTLVFVNTRRMAERAARHLGEMLGKSAVAAHHGSLAKETRLDAEQRLKRGELQVLVATASLELGLDIGDVDLVCQLGSPRSIAAFLQRAGRAGHRVGGTPKARLFPQSRDDLAECAALLDCVRRGELDAVRLLPAPLDVLAQQIVAETACQEWDEDALYALVRRAWPYADLARSDFDAVVRMLAEGFTTRHGPRGGYVHYDAVHRRLRERKGARMTAVMSGGTIPETGDYAVVLEPQAFNIGTVNEDFAVESLAGDVFQLGNASYRIVRVEPGRVRVEDAQGAAPNIPFWLGEAPGRSDELSSGVSRLREALGERFDTQVPDAAKAWLADELGLDAEAAQQLQDYFLRARTALGTLPTQLRIVLERFFDESGGTQLVIHAPFGSRINRAWGLALRKRFCRKFNFELQAAATEDAIVLSLSTSHSFPLIEVAQYLKSASALDVLVQALLDAPLFGVRWRWNATTALALPRFQGGKKVAPQLQRMKSEDLLAAVFPDQVACAENLVGEREIPEHPLVAQTLWDCLYDAMDAAGWLRLLRGIEDGTIEVVACDLPAPSPFAAEALNARPYAYLDDAPIEERRTLAVQARRYADPESAADVGQLDRAAIDAVRAEAWPDAASADEMHEALDGLGVITDREAAANAGWLDALHSLAADGRATRLVVGQAGWWTTAERSPQARALHPDAVAEPPLVAPAPFTGVAWNADDALLELLRARLSGLGPTTAATLSEQLRQPPRDVDAALLRLQGEGYVLQGRFSPDAPEVEWCERHLLARIHRYTLRRLRQEIEPVAARDFARFLFDWQHLGAASRLAGPDAVSVVLAQLEGFEAPAASWEPELIAARVQDYSIAWLDQLCVSGRAFWTRLRPVAAETAGHGGSLRATPLLLLPRQAASAWAALAPPDDDGALGSRARKVLDLLVARGALFFDELLDGAHLLEVELEDALAELVARGHVRCDSYAGLRALLVPPSRRSGHASRRRPSLFGIRDAGRWALVRPLVGPRSESGAAQDDSVEHVAKTLLRRYGVVCWRLLEREAAWLPPWRALVRVYHRLEARGEIRGGRFIAGLSGEQFALPEALGGLRKVRSLPPDTQWIKVAATDPANLLGTVLAGSKVPRVPGASVLYRDGIAVAVHANREVQWLVELDAPERAEALDTLTGTRGAHARPMSSSRALSS